MMERDRMRPKRRDFHLRLSEAERQDIETVAALEGRNAAQWLRFHGVSLARAKLAERAAGHTPDAYSRETK